METVSSLHQKGCIVSSRSFFLWFDSMIFHNHTYWCSRTVDCWMLMDNGHYWRDVVVISYLLLLLFIYFLRHNFDVVAALHAMIRFSKERKKSQQTTSARANAIFLFLFTSYCRPESINIDIQDDWSESVLLFDGWMDGWMDVTINRKLHSLSLTHTQSLPPSTQRLAAEVV